MSKAPQPRKLSRKPIVVTAVLMAALLVALGAALLVMAFYSYSVWINS
jgi:hypothetical protein